jgi:hypothetical protein
LLYKYGKYNLIDPRTALAIFSDMLKITSFNTDKSKDTWLTGDLFGGPPAPPKNAFNNEKMTSCASCSELIRSTIQEIRSTHNQSLVTKLQTDITKCSNLCNENYQKSLINEQAYSKIPQLTRIEQNIRFAEEHCNDYIEDMKYV